MVARTAAPGRLSIADENCFVVLQCGRDDNRRTDERDRQKTETERKAIGRVKILLNYP